MVLDNLPAFHGDNFIISAVYEKAWCKYVEGTHKDKDSVAAGAPRKNKGEKGIEDDD